MVFKYKYRLFGNRNSSQTHVYFSEFCFKKKLYNSERSEDLPSSPSAKYVN